MDEFLEEPSNYIYLEQYPQDLDCPICRMPLLDPHTYPTCLHVFCNTCLVRSIQTVGPFCPIDRSFIQPDQVMRAPGMIGSMVDGLKVRCPGRRTVPGLENEHVGDSRANDGNRKRKGKGKDKSDGLGSDGWTSGTGNSVSGGAHRLGKGRHHQTSPSFHPAASIPKEGSCCWTGERSALRGHLQRNECSPIDDGRASSSSQTLSSSSTATKASSSCPFCSISLPESISVSSHIMTACTLAPRPCPYARYGCGFVVASPARSVDSRTSDESPDSSYLDHSLSYHLSQVCAFAPLSSFFQSVYETRWSDLEDSLGRWDERLEKRLRKLEKKVEGAETGIEGARESLAGFWRDGTIDVNSSSDGPGNFRRRSELSERSPTISGATLQPPATVPTATEFDQLVPSLSISLPESTLTPQYNPDDFNSPIYTPSSQEQTTFNEGTIPPRTSSGRSDLPYTPGPGSSSVSMHTFSPPPTSTESVPPILSGQQRTKRNNKASTLSPLEKHLETLSLEIGKIASSIQELERKQTNTSNDASERNGHAPGFETTMEPQGHGGVSLNSNEQLRDYTASDPPMVVSEISNISGQLNELQHWFGELQSHLFGLSQQFQFHLQNRDREHHWRLSRRNVDGNGYVDGGESGSSGSGSEGGDGAEGMSVSPTEGGSGGFSTSPGQGGGGFGSLFPGPPMFGPQPPPLPSMIPVHPPSMRSPFPPPQAGRLMGLGFGPGSRPLRGYGRRPTVGETKL